MLKWLCSLTNPRACDSLDSLDSYFTLWINMETTNYTLHKTIVFYSAPMILNETRLPLGLVVLYYPEKLISTDLITLKIFHRGTCIRLMKY